MWHKSKIKKITTVLVTPPSQYLVEPTLCLPRDLNDTFRSHETQLLAVSPRHIWQTPKKIWFRCFQQCLFFPHSFMAPPWTPLPSLILDLCRSSIVTIGFLVESMPNVLLTWNWIWRIAFFRSQSGPATFFQFPNTAFLATSTDISVLAENFLFFGRNSAM